MSVQYDLSLVVAMMGPPYHTKAFEGAAVDPQAIGGHVIIVLLAESNKQEQQLVPIGTKLVEVILPLFQGHASSHVSVASQATKAT